MIAFFLTEYLNQNMIVTAQEYPGQEMTCVCDDKDHILLLLGEFLLDSSVYFVHISEHLAGFSVPYTI